MDPLITALDSSGYGYRAGPLARRVKLSALAFADDLAALTSTKREMQKQLGIVEVFCRTTGILDSEKWQIVHGERRCKLEYRRPSTLGHVSILGEA